MISLPRRAARCLRKIWQAHDEKNEDMGMLAAATLFEILGARLSEDKLQEAGSYEIQAYFLADEAEKYQGIDPEHEEELYKKAGELLIKARQICGFEVESPHSTIIWWKAYRHRDMEKTIYGLIEDHKAKFQNLDTGKKGIYAFLCTEKLVTAARAHHFKNWEIVDDYLTEYFELYFKAIGKKTINL